MKDNELKQWEATKADYVERQMASFKKYFGKDAKECPDCNGSAWIVCEKNLRDMLDMTADAVMRSFMGTKRDKE